MKSKSCNLPKTLILTAMILICVGVTYYFHFVLGTEVVFTHFFYVPIVLAGIWWEGLSVWTAAGLGGWLIISHKLSGLSASYTADFSRAGMFIVIGLFVGIIWKKCLRTERKLMMTRDYLDNLLKHSGTPILVWDNKGDINLCNAAFEQLAGHQSENILGKSIRELFSDESFGKIEEALASDYSDAIECPIRCSDGRDAVCLWNAAEIYSEDGQTHLASLIQGQDITKRKWAEDILRKHADELEKLNSKLAVSEKELRELNASKDKFFSIISHDLRSPFMPLLQFCKMLCENIDSLTKEELKEYALGVDRNAKKLYGLVENLLEWARIKTGRMKYNPDILDLGKMVKHNFELLQENADNKNIKLRNEVGGKVFAYADNYQINCVIQNVVSNGIKFTKSGGEVRVSAEHFDNRVEISVADTGVGIDREIMDAIFRIDVYHTTLGTAKERGSGLGLILCKELLEKNGGSIRIKSEPGKGSTFIISLPAEAPAEMSSVEKK